jgi:hypothetical protein
VKPEVIIADTVATPAITTMPAVAGVTATASVVAIVVVSATAVVAEALSAAFRPRKKKSLDSRNIWRACKKKHRPYKSTSPH